MTKPYYRIKGKYKDGRQRVVVEQRYKMMGNAVTVNVIKVIGEKLAQNPPIVRKS